MHLVFQALNNPSCHGRMRREALESCFGGSVVGLHLPPELSRLSAAAIELAAKPCSTMPVQHQRHSPRAALPFAGGTVCRGWLPRHDRAVRRLVASHFSSDWTASVAQICEHGSLILSEPVYGACGRQQ